MKERGKGQRREERPIRFVEGSHDSETICVVANGLQRTPHRGQLRTRRQSIRRQRQRASVGVQHSTPQHTCQAMPCHVMSCVSSLSPRVTVPHTTTHTTRTRTHTYVHACTYAHLDIGNRHLVGRHLALFVEVLLAQQRGVHLQRARHALQHSLHHQHAVHSAWTRHATESTTHTHTRAHSNEYAHNSTYSHI